jgi:hypothetical protein
MLDARISRTYAPAQTALKVEEGTMKNKIRNLRECSFLLIRD